MSLVATVNIISVIRVYPNKAGTYDRCLCLLEGQISGKNGLTTTTEKVFVIAKAGTLPEGQVDLSARVTLTLKRPTAEYPQTELTIFLQNTFAKKKSA